MRRLGWWVAALTGGLAGCSGASDGEAGGGDGAPAPGPGGTSGSQCVVDLDGAVAGTIFECGALASLTSGGWAVNFVGEGNAEVPIQGMSGVWLTDIQPGIGTYSLADTPWLGLSVVTEEEPAVIYAASWPMGEPEPLGELEITIESFTEELQFVLLHGSIRGTLVPLDFGSAPSGSITVDGTF
jgi:hypothetical protein